MENQSDSKEFKNHKPSDTKVASKSFFPNIKDLRGELNKVVWASKEDLTKQTITVVCTSLLFGAIISCMDYIYDFGFKVFVQVLSR